MSRFILILIALFITTIGCARVPSQPQTIAPGHTRVIPAHDAAHAAARDAARAQAQSFFTSWQQTLEAKHHQGLQKLYWSEALLVDPPYRGDLELLRISTWLDPDSTQPEGRCGLLVREAKQTIHLAQIECDTASPQLVYTRALHAPQVESTPGVAPRSLRRPASWAPQSASDAVRLWAQIDPRAEHFGEQLAMLPDRASILRPLARSIVEEGQLRCARTEEVEGCADTYLEWLPLPARAGVEDPCLRRHLLMWALTPGLLGEEDARALAPRLVDIAASEDLDMELGRALLMGTRHFPDDLRMPLMMAAAQHLVVESLAGLEDTSLRALYHERGIDMTLPRLTPSDENNPVLIAALFKPQTAYRNNVRREVFEHLVGAGALNATQLHTLTTDSDCAVAMGAATALAEAGESSALPSPLDASAVEPHLRALCLSAHDTDETRRRAFWSAYLIEGQGPSLDDLPMTFDGWTVNPDPKIEHRQQVQIMEDGGLYTIDFERGEQGWRVIEVAHDYFSECSC